LRSISGGRVVKVGGGGKSEIWEVVTKSSVDSLSSLLSLFSISGTSAVSITAIFEMMVL